jgi:hypothetical protein
MTRATSTAIRPAAAMLRAARSSAVKRGLPFTDGVIWESGRQPAER